MQRIYGTAKISERFIDRNYFREAHLALDNRTCCYDDNTCAYSTLDNDNNPVKQDMVVWWSLDMKDQHYIDHIEIYGWVGNFSTHSHISIGPHVNMTTNPRCSPSTPTNIHPDAALKPMTYIPNACQGDKLVGRHLAIFKYVSEGETEFSATAVNLCEVIVYGEKID